MLESEFQSHLIKKLKRIFNGCIVIKNDPNYIQGLPDLLVLYQDKWVALEVKRNAHASVRPNQQYYVEQMNAMSYSTFIFPENEEVIFNEIQQIFSS